MYVCANTIKFFEIMNTCKQLQALVLDCANPALSFSFTKKDLEFRLLCQELDGLKQAGTGVLS